MIFSFYMFLGEIELHYLPSSLQTFLDTLPQATLMSHFKVIALLSFIIIIICILMYMCTYICICTNMYVTQTPKSILLFVYIWFQDSPLALDS